MSGQFEQGIASGRLSEPELTQNFAELGSATQVFLSLLMLLGRLEFFAVLVLFMPSLWRKY